MRVLNLANRSPGSLALVGCLMLVSVTTVGRAETAQCVAALTPYEAVYTTVYKKITMEGKRSLQRKDNGSYLLSNSARRMGNSISEQSSFTQVDELIRVDDYHRVQSVLGIKREYHSQYDWEQGKVQVTGNADVSLSLDEKPLDLLSYQLALSCDLERGKQEVSYPVVARTRIREYEFRVSGRESLKTKLGDLETIIVDRVRSEDKRSTRLWFAPTLNYLMVKLEQYEKKDSASYTLELKEVINR